jgi:hypothetical protein
LHHALGPETLLAETLLAETLLAETVLAETLLAKTLLAKTGIGVALLAKALLTKALLTKALRAESGIGVALLAAEALLSRARLAGKARRSAKALLERTYVLLQRTDRKAVHGLQEVLHLSLLVLDLHSDRTKVVQPLLGVGVAAGGNRLQLLGQGIDGLANLLDLSL